MYTSNRIKTDTTVNSVNGTGKNVYLDNSRGRRLRTGDRNPKNRPKMTNGDKNLVRQMIESKMEYQSEKKSHVIEGNAGVQALSFSPVLLTNIDQGVGDTERVGDKVVLDRMRLSYAFTAGDNTNVCRVIVFSWKLQTDPTTDTLLQYASGSLAYLATYKPDLEPDYKVIYDRVHYLGSGTNVQGDVMEIILKGKVQYQGGSNTGIGNLYLCCYSDSTAAPSPSVAFQSTVFYYDD